MKRYFKLAVITGVALLFFTPTSTTAQTIEQYEIFELTFKGPVTGNPFTDVILNAEFRFKNRVLQPEGFYDGNGIYKIRMTVMPKNYDVYINNEPPFYPFEGSKEKGWDFSRPNPDFFRNFDKMNHEQEIFYLRYLIARIATYSNVWWSMTNEYDIMGKSPERIAFLHRIMTETPVEGVHPLHNAWNKVFFHFSE